MGCRLAEAALEGLLWLTSPMLQPLALCRALHTLTIRRSPSQLLRAWPHHCCLACSDCVRVTSIAPLAGCPVPSPSLPHFRVQALRSSLLAGVALARPRRLPQHRLRRRAGTRATHPGTAAVGPHSSMRGAGAVPQAVLPQPRTLHQRSGLRVPRRGDRHRQHPAEHPEAQGPSACVKFNANRDAHGHCGYSACCSSSADEGAPVLGVR